MAKEEPRIIEASVSRSVGAKVQVVKYENSQDYFLSMGQKWEIPEGWTEEEAEEFRLNKLEEFREQLEEPAQAAMDELMDLRESLN
jgi:hypothetical protein